MTAMELKILDGIQALRTPVGDTIMCFFTKLGNAGALWIALAVVLLAIPKTRKCGMAVAAIIAFSRMYLYVHYPTDILGGIVIGVLSGYIGKCIMQYRRKQS